MKRGNQVITWTYIRDKDIVLEATQLSLGDSIEVVVIQSTLDDDIIFVTMRFSVGDVIEVIMTQSTCVSNDTSLVQ